MNRLLPFLVLGMLLPLSAGAQTYEVETLQSAGPSDRRIDLVLLGDGYRAQDQQKMHDDAVSLVTNLFGLTPFKEYKPLFNVRLIHAVSNEVGADFGSAGGTRDTALGAAYNCNNIDRLLCVDMDKVKTVAAQNTPAYDQLVVIVNDTKYGGSGGEVAAVSLATSAGEILRHELGHSLGKLADEYSDAYPGYPACVNSSQPDCPEANATVKNTRDTVKWRDWIESTTQVPTTPTGASQLIGAYEGCRYQTRGVYRPKDADCLMKVLGHPYCSVCGEGMVRAFYKLASPVDTYSPNSATANVTACGPVTFSVTPPFSGAFSFLWTVDGAPRGGDNKLTLSSADLGAGQHTVAVTVSDQTPLVRSDPQNALKETQSWRVTAGTCQAAGPCEVSAGCDASGACVKTLKAAGTACGAQTCKGSLKTAPAACSASGECVATAPVSCGAYTCDEAANDCRTSCTADNQCSTGFQCVNGACASPQQPPEQPKGCFGCSTGGGTGGVAMALAMLAWLTARRRARAYARR